MIKPAPHLDYYVQLVYNDLKVDTSFCKTANKQGTVSFKGNI